MKDDAKSTNQDKHSMLMDLKLKASRRTYTMAMSTKPQRAKMTKTVPKDTKTRLEHALEQGKNMLRNGPKIKGIQSYKMEDCSTPITTKHGMDYMMKNRAIICQNDPQNPLRWRLNDLNKEACTMAQTWSIRPQLFKTLKGW